MREGSHSFSFLTKLVDLIIKDAFTVTNFIYNKCYTNYLITGTSVIQKSMFQDQNKCCITKVLLNSKSNGCLPTIFEKKPKNLFRATFQTVNFSKAAKNQLKFQKNKTCKVNNSKFNFHSLNKNQSAFSLTKRTFVGTDNKNKIQKCPSKTDFLRKHLQLIVKNGKQNKINISNCMPSFVQKIKYEPSLEKPQAYQNFLQDLYLSRSQMISKISYKSSKSLCRYMEELTQQKSTQPSNKVSNALK